MREIKFRAYHKKSRQMKPVIAIEANMEVRVGDMKWWYPNYTVLMQYTGLKDKNGKEIYEGDILAIGEPQVEKKAVGVVSYQQGYFGYNAPWLTGKQEPVPLKEYCNEIFKECVEIIGNIYENPEFLSDTVDKPKKMVYPKGTPWDLPCEKSGK